MSNWGIGSAGSFVACGGSGLSGCAGTPGEMARSRPAFSQIRSQTLKHVCKRQDGLGARIQFPSSRRRSAPSRRDGCEPPSVRPIGHGPMLSSAFSRHGFAAARGKGREAACHFTAPRAQQETGRDIRPSRRLARSPYLEMFARQSRVGWDGWMIRPLCSIQVPFETDITIRFPARERRIVIQILRIKITGEAAHVDHPPPREPSTIT